MKYLIIFLISFFVVMISFLMMDSNPPLEKNSKRHVGFYTHRLEGEKDSMLFFWQFPVDTTGDAIPDLIVRSRMIDKKTLVYGKSYKVVFSWDYLDPTRPRNGQDYQIVLFDD